MSPVHHASSFYTGALPCRPARYTTAGWANFFVAEVSAAAALTDLLFVAVSINLSKILSIPHLPGRAGESLVMLMGALMVSTLGLVPKQPRIALGAEVLGVGLLVWLYPMRIQRRAAKLGGVQRGWVVTRAIIHQIGTVPLLVAGLSVFVGRGGGLYWLVPGTLLAFASGILNSWVLLVEIQALTGRAPIDDGAAQRARAVARAWSRRSARFQVSSGECWLGRSTLA
jgi:hypothetical protein